MPLAAGHDQRALCAAGERRRLDHPGNRPGGFPEVSRPGERNDLLLVREKHVHPFGDQFEEGLPVPRHAKRVGQGERNLAPGCAGGVRELHHRRLGRGRVPQIAFQIGDGRRGRRRLVDVGRFDLRSGSEHGEHAALGIGRDEDKTATGSGAGRRRWRVEPHARLADIPAEGVTCIVVAHPADITGPGPEGGEARSGVARRTARRLGRGLDLRVKHGCLRLVDQGHDSLIDAVFGQPGIVHMDQHVQHGVADGQDIEHGVLHGNSKDWETAGV